MGNVRTDSLVISIAYMDAQDTCWDRMTARGCSSGLIFLVASFVIRKGIIEWDIYSTVKLLPYKNTDRSM